MTSAHVFFSHAPVFDGLSTSVILSQICVFPSSAPWTTGDRFGRCSTPTRSTGSEVSRRGSHPHCSLPSITHSPPVSALIRCQLWFPFPPESPVNAAVDSTMLNVSAQPLLDPVANATHDAYYVTHAAIQARSIYLQKIVPRMFARRFR